MIENDVQDLQGQDIEGAGANPERVGVTESDIPGQDNPDNLAFKLSQEKRDEIGRLVVDEYDADLRSRSGWDERRAKWLKLMSGQRDPKTFPWPKASNTHWPALAVACIQYQARAAEALLPPKDIMQCLSFEGAAAEAARRITQHMNWQLNFQMDEFYDDMDVMLIEQALNGSGYKKTYFDVQKGRNVSRMLGVDELVTPYKVRRLEESPRITHALRMSVNDINIRGKSTVYIDTDRVPDEGTPIMSTTPTPSYQDQADKTNNETETPYYDDRRLLLEQHRWLDIDNDGIKEPYIATVDYETRVLLRLVSRLYDDPVTGNTEILEFFTAYPFIPNPNSHYGYGFGHLIEHLNETGTSILNQLIDAGTLANLQGGFVRKRSGMAKGSISWYPGQFKEIDTMSDDIRKDIFAMPFKEPSQALFALLGLLREYVQEVTSVSEAMLGKMPASDTKATALLAVLEEGRKVFSQIHKRNFRSFKKELKKLFILNRINCDEKEYYYVQNSESEEFRTLQTGRKDYTLGFWDVVPVADPNITSRAERMIKAESSLNVALSNPLTQQDPDFIYEATKEYYRAMESPLYLKIKKPQPQEPPDIPPVEENAMFIRETYPQPLPIQDHEAHIAAHQIFLESMFGQQLSPQGTKLFEAHMKEHLSFLYLAATGVLQQKMEQEAQLKQAAALQQQGGMNAA